MAASSGKRTSASKKSTNKRNGNNSTHGNRKRKPDAYQTQKDMELFHEIGLIVLFVVMVILFCCNFGIIGPVGDYISGVLFGLFGFTAYIAPVVLFLGIAFWFANEGNPTALRKVIAGIVLFFMLGMVCELIAGNVSAMEEYDVKEIYEICKSH